MTRYRLTRDIVFKAGEFAGPGPSQSVYSTPPAEFLMENGPDDTMHLRIHIDEGLRTGLLEKVE